MFKVYLIISVASFCKVVLSANPFPVVDLGYARHQALTYDVSNTECKHYA